MNVNPYDVKVSYEIMLNFTNGECPVTLTIEAYDDESDHNYMIEDIVVSRKVTAFKTTLTDDQKTWKNFCDKYSNYKKGEFNTMPSTDLKEFEELTLENWRMALSSPFYSHVMQIA